MEQKFQSTCYCVLKGKDLDNCSSLCDVQKLRNRSGFPTNSWWPNRFKSSRRTQEGKRRNSDSIEKGCEFLKNEPACPGSFQKEKSVLWHCWRSRESLLLPSGLGTRLAGKPENEQIWTWDSKNSTLKQCEKRVNKAARTARNHSLVFNCLLLLPKLESQTACNPYPG